MDSGAWRVSAGVTAYTMFWLAPGITLVPFCQFGRTLSTQPVPDIRRVAPSPPFFQPARSTKPSAGAPCHIPPISPLQPPCCLPASDSMDYAWTLSVSCASRPRRRSAGGPGSGCSGSRGAVGAARGAPRPRHDAAARWLGGAALRCALLCPAPLLPFVSPEPSTLQPNIG